MKKSLLLLLLPAVLVLGSCRRDNLKYDVPTTYIYDATEIAEQKALSSMLGEMIDYAESAAVPGVVLDAAILKDMFRNQNSRFSFASSLSLSADEPNAAIFDVMMDSLALASTSTTAAAPGVAGVATSADGLKKYLLSANGWDYTERIEKGIMGTVFYRQASTLMGSRHDDDVKTTASSWGRAFGKLGLSADYPASVETFRSFGKSFKDFNPLIKTNDSLMEAFILGRTALEEEDDKTVLAQIEIIADQWETGIAAKAIHYLNKAKNNLGDDALRNHYISECVGFLSGLQANSDQVHKISQDQLQTILNGFGTNLYLVTLADVEQARTILADAYSLNGVKDQL